MNKLYKYGNNEIIVKQTGITKDTLGNIFHIFSCIKTNDKIGIRTDLISEMLTEIK